MTDCGIAGIVAKDPSVNVAPILYIMGAKLQHRGELSCGMCLYNSDSKEKLQVHKGEGLVNVFFKDKIHHISGSRGAIHVRYATSGFGSGCNDSLDEIARKSFIENTAQPFYRRHGNRWKRFAIVWNGNLTNTDELADWLQKERHYDLTTDADTELIMHTLAISAEAQSENLEKPNIKEIFEHTVKKIQGAYSLLYLNGAGDLAAVRDPYAVRPFCYGENDKVFAVASETIALQNIGIKEFKYVEPGELLVFSDKLNKFKIAESPRTASCVFERVYFSHVVSEMEEGPVLKARQKLGIELARAEPLKNRKDLLVVPVPDTSKTAAKAFAEALGFPYVQEGIIKSTYGRGFIEPKRTREEKMRMKYDFIRATLSGKNIILFDDSIIRGETMSLLLWMIYQSGVKEVHVRSTYPPVVNPCFYGIDFPDPKELIANNISYETVEQLEQRLAEKFMLDVKSQAKANIDFKVSVKYITLEALIHGVGLPKNKLCCACLDGEYPIKV